MAQLHDRLIDAVSTAIEDHIADDGATWELLPFNAAGNPTIDNTQSFNANGLGADAVNSNQGTAVARCSAVAGEEFVLYFTNSHRAAQGQRRNYLFFCIPPTGTDPADLDRYRLLINNSTTGGDTVQLHKIVENTEVFLASANPTVASVRIEFRLTVTATGIVLDMWDGSLEDWVSVLSSDDTDIRGGCIGTAFHRAGDANQYLADFVMVDPSGDTIPIDVHDDTFINSAAGTTNYSTADVLLVGGTDTGTGAAQRRSLFRAALRRLPPLTVPTRAELVLHRHSNPNIGGGAGVEIFARPCLRDYVSDEVTWSQWASGQSWGATGGTGYGTDRGPGIWGECPVPDDTPGDEYRIEITPMVTDALADGQQAVTGWVSVNSSEGGQAIELASSRYATVAHRPYVEIEYASVHDSTAPFVLDAAADTYINSQATSTNYEGAGLLFVGALGGWDSASFTRHALIRFDIDGMAPDPDEVILRVVSTSGQTPTLNGSMQARECLRDFVADEATWNVYSTGNSWQTAGARGASDRGADVYVGTSWSWWYPGRAAYVDVTDLVADAIANEQSTLDVILTYVTSNNGVFLWESEAGTLSARPSLLVTPASGGGPVTHHGEAHLTGSGTLAAAGRVRHHGAVTLTGSATIAAEAHRAAHGAADLTAAGTLAADAHRATHGAAALTGVGTLQARAGSAAHHGEADLTGSGTLAAAARRKVHGAVTLTGSGALAPTARRVVHGRAELTSAGLLDADAHRAAHAAAALTGVGTLAARASGGTEAVTPPERTLVVAHEDRVMLIPAETRIMEVHR